MGFFFCRAAGVAEGCYRGEVIPELHVEGVGGEDATCRIRRNGEI